MALFWCFLRFFSAFISLPPSSPAVGRERLFFLAADEEVQQQQQQLTQFSSSFFANFSRRHRSRREPGAPGQNRPTSSPSSRPAPGRTPRRLPPSAPSPDGQGSPPGPGVIPRARSSPAPPRPCRPPTPGAHDSRARQQTRITRRRRRRRVSDMNLPSPRPLHHPDPREEPAFVRRPWHLPAGPGGSRQ